MRFRCHAPSPAIAIAGFFLAGLMNAFCAAAESRPNILFILADDQRFDTIHALGNEEIHTPYLDVLANRGCAFLNAYCQGGMSPAVCLPSRTQLLTGKSVFQTPPLNSKTYDGPMLPSVFRAAGYATFHCGKRGNSFLPGMEAFETVQYSHTGNTGKDEERQPRQPQIVADAAIEFLKSRNSEKPFFIYLAPHYPHDPRVAPEEFQKQYDPAKIALPKNFLPMHPFDNGDLKIRDELLAPHPRTPEVMRRHIADYYACITNFDHHIGRIVATLKEQGQLDRTLIVFTSDQGLAVGGRHGLMGKQNLYEHFKSPLIIAGPNVKPGTTPALVYLYDLFPTLCDLVEIPIPAACDGRSLKPLLTGKEPRVRETLFCAYRNVQRMVRNDRWKLLWYPQIDRFQLFNVQDDPWELDDLSNHANHATTLKMMKAELARQQTIFNDPLPQRPIGE